MYLLVPSDGQVMDVWLLSQSKLRPKFCKGQTPLNWSTLFFAADGVLRSDRAKTPVPHWKDQVASRIKHGVDIPF